VNKVALLVALLAAIAGSVLLLLYLRRFEEEVSGGAKIQVLVARKQIDPGQLLSDGDDMVVTRGVPQAYVEDRAIRSTERPRVVGLRVASRVQAGETLMWTDLAVATDDRRDLSSLVQNGMRALQIRASTNEPSYALIRPGDRVDVISTISEAQEQRVTRVLLQNILVLAVGLDMGNDTSAARSHSDRSDQALTLSVNLEQAELLSLAAERGRLSVALRNPDDPHIVEGVAEINSTILSDSKRFPVESRTHKAGGPVLMGGQP
jgi:pilus assembly protein CpaB